MHMDLPTHAKDKLVGMRLLLAQEISTRIDRAPQEPANLFGPGDGR